MPDEDLPHEESRERGWRGWPIDRRDEKPPRDWRVDDPINNILLNATQFAGTETEETYLRTLRGIERTRRTIANATTPLAGTRQAAVEAQIDKLKAKLERAQALAEKLRNIPEEDPWPDGTALRVQWRGYTYLLLRAVGRWYSTGRAPGAPDCWDWPKLVDWLIRANVEYVQELVSGDRVWLNGEPEPKTEGVPSKFCGQRRVHGAHAWHVGHPPTVYACDGVRDLWCDDAFATVPHAGHEWKVDGERRWCGGA